MFSNWGNYDPEAYKREQEERLKKAREHQTAADAAEAAVSAETDPSARQQKEAELMTLRQSKYKCGDKYTKGADITAWPEYVTQLQQGAGLRRRREVSNAANAKVAMWQGDITSLEVDAVVNAANESCLGGGGIDGAIHSAAGPLLLEDGCRPLNGCPTGQTKITKGYNLPAKHVLHTVGPMGEGDQSLRSCYRTCLALVEQHRLRTVAFCGVGTGIFGFPLERATHIAMDETRKWLDAKLTEGSAAGGYDVARDLDRIIFVNFRRIEVDAYHKLMPEYFPVEGFPGGGLFVPENPEFDDPDPPPFDYSKYSTKWKF